MAVVEFLYSSLGFSMHRQSGGGHHAHILQRRGAIGATAPFLIIISVLAAIATGNGHTDFESRLGSCQFPSPSCLSCRAMPEWGSFLQKFEQNARSGFPIDGELFTEAQEILDRWQAKPYPPQEFFHYLCGGEDSQWPLPDGFCLFGFVGALFVRGRHMMLSDDPEMQKTAEGDFQYATTVLGKEGSMDFLDSSPWPLSILDIYLNINETDFISYGQYARTKPVPPPIAPLESLHWRSPKTGSRVVALSTMDVTTIAVVGSHATLSLEPVDILRRFALDVKLNPVFFGLEPRWCEILGMCNHGTAALGQLFKDCEKDPHAFPWALMTEQITAIYHGDAGLNNAALLLCTEPLAGCMMIRQVAEARGRLLPLLGYLGVALLNGCPPADVPMFWRSFSSLMLGDGSDGRPESVVLSVNNLILSEQIFFQSGVRAPYVRAHGLYTDITYVPLRQKEFLVWRAPLFLYTTSRCTLARFLQGTPDYPINFRWVEDDESIPYQDVAQYKAVVLFPWDHALMTFYELYSAGMPLLLPSADMMYRLLYQRGQLSVGERMYRSIRPGHRIPNVEFAEAEEYLEKAGPPDPAVGMSSAKAARGVAEDMLTRALDASDLDATKQYVKAALELMWDMKYFLTVAENRTDEDSYSSMGVIRRTLAKTEQAAESAEGPGQGELETEQDPSDEPWHPYTPFQMSTRDSNDWTRMRKGGWWLRRGVRFDAMRYWYQFSDFARFPGLKRFDNLPELLCIAQTLDTQMMSTQMRRYNEETLVHSSSFWVHSLATLLQKPGD